MPLVDNAWYVNSTTYAAVTAWAATTAYTVGQIRRQLAAPVLNNERCFICIVAGTSGAAEPTWVLTRGAKTTDGTVTWMECTGVTGTNGDAVNTPSWTITATPPGGVKNTAVLLGQVIKRDSGASYQICTTAGTCGNAAEPAFSNTVGVTTVDGTATWTCIGTSFTGWSSPHARLFNAYAANWGGAGDIFYVRGDHNETQSTANITLTTPGTHLVPCPVYCTPVADVAMPPTTMVSVPTGTLTTTGNFAIVLQGQAGSYEGLIFNAGSGANAQIFQAGLNKLLMKNCSFRKLGTVANVGAVNMASNYAILENCTARFGSTGDRFGIATGGFLVIRNTVTQSFVEAAGAIPVNLFSAGGLCFTEIRGLDISAIGVGGSLVITGAGNYVRVINCKINASVSKAFLPFSGSGIFVDFIRCDSGALNYTNNRYTECGQMDTDITVVRTGGATDGVTPISWRVATTGAARWAHPFECQPITVWNETVGGPITVTVYGIWGGGAVPLTDDIWIDVEYPGSTLTPISYFVNTTKADGISVGTSVSSDTSTWSGSTTKFKMTTTITPQMKGPLTINVRVARPSATFYIDPKVVVI